MEKTLIEAIQSGNLDGVRGLLAQNPALKTEQGNSALMMAIYYRKTAIVELLLNQGIPLDIFAASALGKAEIVQSLLAKHADLVNAYAADGFQPLGLAAYFGHPEVAGLLIQAGAEVNSPSKNGQKVQPLHSSVSSQNFEITQLLLKHGADANATQESGFTPLHGAAFNGDLAIAKLLLSYGANKDSQTIDGKTPLMIAEEKGHSEILTLLK